MSLVNGVFGPYLFFLSWSWLTLSLSSISANRSTYIIHMDKSLMPKAFYSHKKWYSSTIDSLKSTDPYSNGNRSSPSLLYIYENALPGFSAVLSLDELEVLKKSPGFIFACPDSTTMLDTTHTPEFLSLSPSTGLLHVSNFGKDMIIGIIDSGVWPESPSFHNDGIATKLPTKWKGTCEGGQDFNSSMCNAKLIGATYFNEGLKSELKGSMLVIDSARDDSGHGTAVSAIAAGNYVKGVSFFGYAKGTAKGVAPHARVAAYKVAWSKKAIASDVIAAIDRAIADGVDVICLSLGFPKMDLFDDPIAVASFSAMEKGIVVSTSAGNLGPHYMTIHNGFPWVLTVAAGSIDRQIGGTLIMGNGIKVTGWSIFPGTVLHDMPLLYNETLSTCESPALLSEAPYGIIICDIGNVNDQIKSLLTVKLSAAILVSEDPNILKFLNISYPYLVLRPEDAHFVITYAISFDMPSASMRFQQTFVGVKPAPVVAHYSSRGPSKNFLNILKPDIIAPGSLVLAASTPRSTLAETMSPLSSNGYILASGTSFACPHVAGTAALLKSAHPEWSAAAVKSAIITTSYILDNTLHPIQEYNIRLRMASPLAMGAGHIDPNKALDPGLVYNATPQDYVNLLCSVKSYQARIKVITRSENYGCWKPSFDLNYPSIVIYSQRIIMNAMKVERTVTNVGEGPTTYSAIVIEPSGYEVKVMPKTLAFERKYEKRTYTVTVSTKETVIGLSYGQLVWAEENGKHLVRSPIVVCLENFN